MPLGKVRVPLDDASRHMRARGIDDAARCGLGSGHFGASGGRSTGGDTRQMAADSRPFLVVSARPEDAPREAEFASIVVASGIEPRQFRMQRVDVAPLPDSLFDGEYAGAIVGGSPFMLTAPAAEQSEGAVRAVQELTRLAEYSLDTGFPVFFTCFGIGVVARVLGGRVDRRHPEEAGAVTIDRTQAALADPLTSELPESFLALTGHKESVAETPPEATLLATRKEAPVQMFRAGHALYASQFHPEPTGRDFAERAGHYRRAGYFAADEYERVSRSLKAARVETPRRLLARFVELFADDVDKDTTSETTAARPTIISARETRHTPLV